MRVSNDQVAAVWEAWRDAGLPAQVISDRILARPVAFVRLLPSDFQVVTVTIQHNDGLTVEELWDGEPVSVTITPEVYQAIRVAMEALTSPD